jgi:NAD(P)-dependent dehydrogenase (short-subunit alcohol dehydrogenase family)
MASERGKRWALILGASSGFGRATAIELAGAGYDIFGVHLDRKATLPQAEAVVEAVKARGREAIFFNVNAGEAERRGQVCGAIGERFAQDGTPGALEVMLHSLAFGTLRPYIGERAVSQAQMEMTLDVMAHSLVYWTQEIVAPGLMGEGGRVFAMTSAGGRVAWPSYGPVSAAKAALEAHVRQLALELAPRGIRVNAIEAGVTDTPALRKIPGWERLVEDGRRRNPSGRLTTPEDVARAIAALSDERTQWMTGNVIRVDGGEAIAG